MGVALAALVVGCSEPPPLTGNGGSVTFTRITYRWAYRDKLDVLVVLDESASVTGMQTALDDVSVLVRALATPSCEDDNGTPLPERARPEADRGLECTHGRAPFRPIVDIHVGAVSPSRGSHVCGFLAWLPDVERNLPRLLPRGATVHVELDALERGFERLARSGGDGCALMAPTAAFNGDLVRRDSRLAILLVTDAPATSVVALEPYLALRKSAGDRAFPRIVAGHEGAAAREAWLKELTDSFRDWTSHQCFLPVRRTPDLRAPCIVLETLPHEEDTCEAHDMRPGPPEIVEPLLAHRRREGDAAGPGPVCLLEQLTTPPGVTCSRDPRRGWCLGENSATIRIVGACRQALLFSPKGTPLNRARVDILCAESRGTEETTVAGP